jgi:hypothetical protein
VPNELLDLNGADILAAVWNCVTRAEDNERAHLSPLRGINFKPDARNALLLTNMHCSCASRKSVLNRAIENETEFPDMFHVVNPSRL